MGFFLNKQNKNCKGTEEYSTTDDRTIFRLYCWDLIWEEGD